MQREEEEPRPVRRSPGTSRRGSVPDSGRSGARAAAPDLLVTGKQITKRSDRAHSLPGGHTHRRPSSESSLLRRKAQGSPKRADVSHSSKSRETSLEDDISLDLSQASEVDGSSRQVRQRGPLATSTPRPRPGPKPRSTSLHGQMHKLDTRRSQKSLDVDKSRESVFCSRDSLCKNSSASPYRFGECDYSSVSPEYSGQSSVDVSPRAPTTDLVVSPRSQLLSSCDVSTWAECSDTETKVEDRVRTDGEWNSFWADYNCSLGKMAGKGYYDHCPTPYRTEDFDPNDFDLTMDSSRKRSPDSFNNITHIIRNEGLCLTPRETQNIIKCAHILGNVLSRAIERRSREKEIAIVKEIDADETENKKKNLTLDLKETAIPLEVKEEKRHETTQTDISLPNTKSAPRIFESILRQLSKSSIDEEDETTEAGESQNNGKKDK